MPQDEEDGIDKTKIENKPDLQDFPKNMAAPEPILSYMATLHELMGDSSTINQSNLSESTTRIYDMIVKSEELETPEPELNPNTEAYPFNTGEPKRTSSRAIINPFIMKGVTYNKTKEESLNEFTEGISSGFSNILNDTAGQIKDALKNPWADAPQPGLYEYFWKELGWNNFLRSFTGIVEATKDLFGKPKKSSNAVRPFPDDVKIPPFLGGSNKFIDRPTQEKLIFEFDNGYPYNSKELKGIEKLENFSYEDAIGPNIRLAGYNSFIEAHPSPVEDSEILLNNLINSVQTDSHYTERITESEENIYVPNDKKTLNLSPKPGDNVDNMATIEKFWNGGEEFKNYSPIQLLARSAPDFMSNKFDVYFLWNPEETKCESFEKLDSELIYPWATDLEKSILNHKGFAVRTGTIKFPNPINNDYTVPFLETQINKIRSTKSMDMQASFSFRMDQDLHWLEEFNILSGRLGQLDASTIDPAGKNKFLKAEAEFSPTNGPWGNWQELFKCISKTWPRKDNRIKRTGLCLIIKMVHLHNFIHTGIQQEILPYFVFENIKILGTGDKIEYNRDTADPLTMNINFIFRRAYQIYASDLPNGKGEFIRVTNSSQSKPMGTDKAEFTKINGEGPGYHFKVENAVDKLRRWEILTYEHQYNDMANIKVENVPMAKEEAEQGAA
jgi:hypothetical protein